MTTMGRPATKLDILIGVCFILSFILIIVVRQAVGISKIDRNAIYMQNVVERRLNDSNQNTTRILMRLDSISAKLILFEESQRVKRPIPHLPAR